MSSLMPEDRRRRRRPFPSCPHCGPGGEPLELNHVSSKPHCKSPTCDWRRCGACDVVVADHYGNHVHYEGSRPA